MDLAYNKTTCVVGVLKDRNPSLVLITIARGERERRENERSGGQEGASFVINCVKLVEDKKGKKKKVFSGEVPSGED